MADGVFPYSDPEQPYPRPSYSAILQGNNQIKQDALPMLTSTQLRAKNQIDVDTKGIHFLPITQCQGKIAVLFPIDNKLVLVDKLKYVLIGKFSHGRPSWLKIKEFFTQLKLAGSYNISIFDQKHIYIECSNKIDFNRIWLRLQWSVDGCPMRILKWVPEFSPSIESPIVPVWIRMEGIPLYMYEEMQLMQISNVIGKPLRIDSRNLNRSMLNNARVCVELDITKPLIESFLVCFEDSISGEVKEQFNVDVYYDNVPHYCTVCSHVGHKKELCKRNQPSSQNADATKRQMHTKEPKITKTWVVVNSNSGTSMDKGKQQIHEESDQRRNEGITQVASRSNHGASSSKTVQDMQIDNQDLAQSDTLLENSTVVAATECCASSIARQQDNVIVVDKKSVEEAAEPVGSKTKDSSKAQIHLAKQFDISQVQGRTTGISAPLVVESQKLQVNMEAEKAAQVEGSFGSQNSQPVQHRPQTADPKVATTEHNLENAGHFEPRNQESTVARDGTIAQNSAMLAPKESAEQPHSKSAALGSDGQVAPAAPDRSDNKASPRKFVAAGSQQVDDADSWETVVRKRSKGKTPMHSPSLKPGKVVVSIQESSHELLTIQLKEKNVSCNVEQQRVVGEAILAGVYERNKADADHSQKDPVPTPQSKQPGLQNSTDLVKTVSMQQLELSATVSQTVEDEALSKSDAPADAQVAAQQQEQARPVIQNPVQTRTWADQCEQEQNARTLASTNHSRFIDLEQVDILDDVFVPTRPGSAPPSPRIKSKRFVGLDDLALVHSKELSLDTSEHEEQEWSTGYFEEENWAVDMEMVKERTSQYKSRCPQKTYNLRTRIQSRKGYKK